MWVVRPVCTGDHDALIELAGALGPGMTTLPSDRDALAEKIESSSRSFSGKLPPEQSQYLLVLEDLDSRKVLGTAGVYPRIGYPGGFFSFRVEKLVQYSAVLERSRAFDVLHLSNAYSGMTEVGTLAVHPGVRKGGAGRLLARSRYMLIAMFPDLFADHVIAEMRGWQDENHESPFWSAVGAHCFGLSFADADALSATKGTAWIADLLPKYPIYVDWLPQSARERIGQAHASSAIAMAMLLKEGFRYDRYVDVFDAGPQVIARRDEIRTVESCLRRGLRVCPRGESAVDSLLAAGDLETFRLVGASASVACDHLKVTADVQRGLGAHSEQQIFCSVAS